MDRSAFARTMRVLERRHPFHDWSAGMTPFEILISTVLSQSTTVANERRGFAELRERLGAVTPGVLTAASEQEIAQAIWHAGLARQKAPRIHAIALDVLRRCGGSLIPTLRLPTRQAREALMSLPGVGPKTADVVLAMAADHPTFPVDTHIARIARRWNLVTKGDYESTRAALEAWTPPRKRKAWHLALIAHGRELCKAHNPRCDACPVRRDCDWYRSHGVRKRGGLGGRGRARTPGNKGLRTARGLARVATDLVRA
ncbi:MAG TPA: endonuclease III [Thermoplasmata archaeon]|nr:endonuclease III [Thermoplasmata archaeon]